jgi:hypothetical protein
LFAVGGAAGLLMFTGGHRILTEPDDLGERRVERLAVVDIDDQDPVIGPVRGDMMTPDRVMTTPLPMAVTLPGRLDAWLFTDSRSVARARVTVILPRLVAVTAGAAGQ